MTVKELKEALEVYPDDLLVVAYDGGDPPDLCVVDKLYPDKNNSGVEYLVISAHGEWIYYLKP